MPSMPGHLQVDEHHVGLRALGRLGRALAVHGDHDHFQVVLLAEGHLERFPERSVVVDDDDGDAGLSASIAYES